MLRASGTPGRTAALAPLLLLAHRVRPARRRRDLDGLRLGLGLLRPGSPDECEAQGDEAPMAPILSAAYAGFPGMRG